MKNILIVGCASTTGAYLGEELSNRNYRIYGTYYHHIPLNPANYEQMIKVNLLERGEISKLDEAIKNTDIIIFTVGDTNFSHDSKTLHDINFTTLKHFVDHMKSIKCDKRIVFCSSTSVYSGVKAIEVDEHTPRKPMNVYGRAKMEAEDYLSASGLNHIIIRLPIIYGPAFAFKFARMFEAAKTNSIKIFGEGNNKIPFVCEEDILSAILKIIESDVNKESFIISTGSITQAEYWKAVCEVLNTNTPEKLPLEKAFAIAEKQLRQFKEGGKTPRLLKEDVDTFSRNRTYDCTGLTRATGWQSRCDFSATIKRTFLAKKRILRESGNKLLLSVFPESTLPYQQVHSHKDIDQAYFGKHPELTVWSVSVKFDNQVPSITTLFSTKLNNIISEMKKFEKEHYFIIRKSPAKANILCHGSFLIDKKNFGEKSIVTFAMHDLKKGNLSKTNKGLTYDVLPRDFDTDLSLEVEHGKVHAISDTEIYKKIRPAVEIIKKDIMDLDEHLKKCDKEGLIVPCLFIVTDNLKVYYVAMGM